MQNEIIKASFNGLKNLRNKIKGGFLDGGMKVRITRVLGKTLTVAALISALSSVSNAQSTKSSAKIKDILTASQMPAFKKGLTEQQAINLTATVLTDDSLNVCDEINASISKGDFESAFQKVNQLSNVFNMVKDIDSVEAIYAFRDRIQNLMQALPIRKVSRIQRVASSENYSMERQIFNGITYLVGTGKGPDEANTYALLSNDFQNASNYFRFDLLQERRLPGEESVGLKIVTVYVPLSK